MKRNYEAPNAELIGFLPRESLAVILDPEATAGGEQPPVSAEDGDIDWEFPV